MADPANLFGEGNSPAPAPTALDNDPFADKLKAILGADGKPKYANTQVALDALFASQAHIATLEAEKAQERAEIERLREVERNAKTLEEVAERLSRNNNSDPSKVTPNGGVDETTVTSLVKRALDDRDRQSLAQANLNRVNNVLTEKFKDKAPDVVAAKAKELNMTPKELGELSSRNPQLVLSLFGSIPTSTPSTITSSIHIPSDNKSDELKPPEQSIMSGRHATDKNRQELMAKIKADVYKKYDVTT